jgi:hypothetical protein
MYGSPIEIIRYRNSGILCLNRRYFFTDRYNYKHIIGNYKITTKFGNIYTHTGDKIIAHKGYLGTLFDVKNHSIKILGNDLREFESIYIFFDDNFDIELEQDLNIFEKIIKIKNIIFQDDILTLLIMEFPEEMVLNDETIIKLIYGDGKLFSISIKIIDNNIILEVFDYNKNDFYFYIQKNDKSNKSMKIIIDGNWEKIIGYN